MPVSNSITSAALNNGNGSSSDSTVTATTQPTQPGFWIDNGILTFFDGTSNNIMDFNSGNVTSAFGTFITDG